MKINTKKLLSVILVVMILFTAAPFSAVAADKYSDVKGHWAENAINTWSDYGILLGYEDGNFRPGNDITRAEMAAIINRVMDYTERSPNGTFSDVTLNDWFSDDILKLHAAGIISVTTGRVNPNEKITREEAVTMIAKAFDIYDETARTNFTDESSIDNWALPYVRGMKADRYINGYEDGSFRPKGVLTRAEVVTILDNIIQGFFNTYATHGSNSRTTTIYGNLVISSPDVSLINYDITGNVYITPGVGRGEVDLSGTTISGTLYVWGGGSNTIRLRDSNVSNIVLDNAATRVFAASSTLRNVNILNGIFEADDSSRITTIDMKNGTVNLLYRVEVDRVTASGGSINIENQSNVSDITAASTAINIKSNATVGKITINRGYGASLRVDGTLRELMSDEDITVSGSGTIEKSNLVKENVITVKSITADGSNSALTSKLTLTFDKDIANLSVNDITITMVNNLNTGVIKGTLTKTENMTGVYELTLNNITQSGYVNVTVSKSGFEITDSRSQKDIYLYYIQTTNVVVSNILPDGSQSYRTSKITFTFSQDIQNLAAADFKISDPGNTGAAISSLVRVDTGKYELYITNIVLSGNITVSLAKPGYTFTTSTAATNATKLTTYVSGNIYVWYNINTLTQVAFNGLTADGGTTGATTYLRLTFSQDIQPSDIVISSGTASGLTGTSGNASKGTLTKYSAGVYDLSITPLTAGTINVTVTPPAGYTYTPSSRSVTIYKPDTTQTSFNGATANGSSSGTNAATTTKITLTFSSNFNIATTTLYNAISFTSTGGTGITKQSIESLGNGQYDLYVSGISASGSVTINIGAISGYTINNPSRTAQVYYSGNNVNFTYVTANGVSGAASTTMLTLIFDKAIPGLAITDITLSGGATISGTLGTTTTAGVYNLPITVSSGNASRNITVTVNKSGYTITPSSVSATVYYANPAENRSVYPINVNGSTTEATTTITVSFAEPVLNLVRNDFRISSTDNPNIAITNVSGSSIEYVLTVTGITRSGDATLSFSKTGYTFGDNHQETFSTLLRVYAGP